MRSRICAILIPLLICVTSGCTADSLIESRVIEVNLPPIIAEDQSSYPFNLKVTNHFPVTSAASIKTVSCGCLNVKLSSDSLAPSKSADLSLELSTRGVGGPKLVVCDVELKPHNGLPSQLIQFRISTTIITKGAALPDAIDFGTVAPLSTSSRVSVVSIPLHEREELALESIDCDSPSITFSAESPATERLTEAVSIRRQPIRLTLSAEQCAGFYTSVVTAKFKGATGVIDVPIRLSWHVPQRLRAIPPAVLFSAQSSSEVASHERKVTILSTGISLANCTATLSNSRFVHVKQLSKTDRQLILSISIDFSVLKEGPFSESITITASDNTSLSIPISGYVGSAAWSD